jgi:hypothetical protein
MEIEPIKSSDEKPDETGKALEALTEQNWLFINHYLATGDVRKAYENAGYKGKNQSSPYQLFKTLKRRIEELSDLDITSRARLQADLRQVMGLPLAEKKELTLKEWLAVRKFVADITPEAKADKPQISFLVINRNKPINGVSDIIDVSDLSVDQKNVLNEEMDQQ